MKRILFVITLVMSATFPLLAHAQASVTGSGFAYTSTPPTCDAQTEQKAKDAADNNAALQCQGPATRSSDYNLTCKLIAHGYAAGVLAVAEYICAH